MFRTRMLARLVIPVLAATALQTLAAEEPAGTTPAAQSIREWKSTPSATPAADAAPTTANSIHEWRSNPAAAPGADGATTQANSIRGWKSKPLATPAASPCATPTANPAAAPAATSAAKPAVSAAVATSPMTISITSSLREGNLVVVLDDVPIFNEKFQKPVLLISQTTTWDPLQVAAGEHRLSAKVYGTKKTYLSATYDLNLSRTKGSALRFVMKDDKLTVELAS